ncbi:unnamed protein product [Rangifer tarandus platyrhynchus]|uniref:Uncharacterized protein n=1 Tax=Rangifer tarandus platyrhynchus TaxID=3082113 RepID=A0AC59ZA56_RANTA
MPLGLPGWHPPSCLPLPMVLSGTSRQGAPVPQSQGQVPCWARVSEALHPPPPAPATEPWTAAAHQGHGLMEPLQRRLPQLALQAESLMIWHQQSTEVLKRKLPRISQKSRASCECFIMVYLQR